MLKNILVLKIFTFITLLSSNTLSKGQPTEWQLSFQEAASPLMQNLIDFHDFVFWVITFITVFVFFYLLTFVSNLVHRATKHLLKPHTIRF